MGIVALQCCISFNHTMKRISAMFTHIPSTLDLPPTLSHTSPLGHHALSSLGSTAASHQPSILHMVVYICQRYSLCSSHALLLPLCPQVRSLPPAESIGGSGGATSAVNGRRGGNRQKPGAAHGGGVAEPRKVCRGEVTVSILFMEAANQALPLSAQGQCSVDSLFT